VKNNTWSLASVLEIAIVLLIDTHVHVYDSFDADRFLDCAADYLAHESKRRAMAAPVAGTLMLSETSRDHFFERFIQSSPDSRWSSRPTQEACSSIACREGRAMLILIAGRQIMTQENLEVLALGCPARFEDGQPIESIIHQVLDLDGLCVLPWGVGKWTGKRGRLIKQLIDSNIAKDIFLSDNANRLMASPMPPLLRYGQEREMKVLAGSDPLPMQSHVNRGGTYGVVLDAPITLETPGADIGRAIRKLEHSPVHFGQRSGIDQFVVSQVAMQWRKRFKRTS